MSLMQPINTDKNDDFNLNLNINLNFNIGYQRKSTSQKMSLWHIMRLNYKKNSQYDAIAMGFCKENVLVYLLNTNG